MHAWTKPIDRRHYDITAKGYSVVEQLLIVADDLTGAADCAARCHRAGLSAHVLLEPGTALPDAGAIAVSTDSRMLPAALAARRVTEVVAQLAVTEKTRWYKKIDSTLRGNIGAELAALLCYLQHVTGRRLCAVLSPGFPAQQRGCEDGYLVHAQTQPRTVDLPALLAAQSELNVTLLPLPVVRQGVTGLAEAMADAYAGGAEVLVVDGINDEDLAAVVDAAKLALPHLLFCGSAGLVEPLARAMATANEEPSSVTATLPGNIVAVIGSGSPMAHQQLAYACRSPDVECLQVDYKLEAQGPRSRQRHRIVVLHLPLPSVRTSLEGPEARGQAQRLVEEALGVYTVLGEAVWVVSGGDTAATLSRQLGVQELRVVQELLPGMPLVAGLGPEGEEYWMVLKSGNHGTQTSLAELFDLLVRSHKGG